MRRRRLIAMGTMLFTISLLLSIKAYAGDINGNEQSVLGVVQGTFEYEGVSYKAAPGYIGQASAQLSEDGVDLTAEQAAEAISEIYANVKTGIAEGYIIPTESVEEKTASSSGSTSDKKENTDKSSEKETKKDTTKEKDTEKESNKETKKEQEKAPIIVNNSAGKIEAIDQDGNSLFVAESIVKDTGFEFLAVFVVIGSILAGIGICFMFILKKQLLAHGHES